MDVIQRLAQFWVEMIVAMDPALKVYLLRVALGLMSLQVLAVQFVRAAGIDEFTLGRQIVTLTLGVMAMALPAQMMLEAPEALQVTVVSLGLWVNALVPYFLPFSLIRTYGRQIMFRRVLYAVIGLGAVFQLAISGG